MERSEIANHNEGKAGNLLQISQALTAISRL
jgi:hypothetical protein